MFMRLFNWRAGRDQSRPALSSSVARSGVPLTAEWPRSYEAQVREGYLGNAVAQRAVRLVAESVAGAPVEASDAGLEALLQVAPGGSPLLEAVSAQLLLHGNAFVQILADPDGAPVELWALRPERVSIETDAAGWPAAYRYKVGDRVTRLLAEGPRPEVAHLKFFHPLDDHYGLGCLGAAATAIQIHNAAGRWSQALLGNAARPSGALVHDPGDGSALTAEQFERIRTEMEAGFSGAANAGRPMLLEGGLRWQPLSLTPADLDFAGTRAAAAREIALAFGVPPMMLGQPGDNTYANYKEANRALWRLQVLPLAGTILDALAKALSGWFPAACARVKLDAVPALSEDRAALWAAATAADFLTTEEKRAMVGLS